MSITSTLQLSIPQLHYCSQLRACATNATEMTCLQRCGLFFVWLGFFPLNLDDAQQIKQQRPQQWRWELLTQGQEFHQLFCYEPLATPSVTQPRETAPTDTATNRGHLQIQMKNARLRSSQWELKRRATATTRHGTISNVD